MGGVASEGAFRQTVAAWQGLPQTLGSLRTAVAEHPGNDASTGSFHGEPEPYFIRFIAHESPHFIEFQRFFWAFLLRSRGNGEEATRAFFSSFATVTRATGVARTMLR